MRKFKASKTLCYLCGLKGADTKDHVPPKGLFKTVDAKIQRLTLPSHKACNNEFSKDEEYFRDVNIQQAVVFNMSNVEEIRKKIWRSWGKSGWNRYQTIIKTATPILIRSRATSLITEAISISPNADVLNRVAIKIARGIIYNDTGAVTKQEDYKALYILASEVPQLKEKDKDQPYWKLMSSDLCLHDLYGPHIAARRMYIVENVEQGENEIRSCFMGLMIFSSFYIIIAGNIQIPKPDDKTKT